MPHDVSAAIAALSNSRVFCSLFAVLLALHLVLGLAATWQLCVRCCIIHVLLR
jgi:energy-converting hydrogenase Eha subunit F